jgi:hypothetical protein
MYATCDICGSPGHRAKAYDPATGKGCPVFRLNEQQTGFGTSRPAAQRASSLALGSPRKEVERAVPRAQLDHRFR